MSFVAMLLMSQPSGSPPVVAGVSVTAWVVCLGHAALAGWLFGKAAGRRA